MQCQVCKEREASKIIQIGQEMEWTCDRCGIRLEYHAIIGRLEALERSVFGSKAPLVDLGVSLENEPK